MNWLVPVAVRIWRALTEDGVERPRPPPRNVPKSSVSPTFRVEAGIHMIIESAPTEEEFKKQLQFCIDYTSDYDVGKTVQISILIYGKLKHYSCDFSEFSDHSYLSKKLMQIPYLEASAGTDGALETARKKSFGAQRRSDIKQIAVVLTECRSQDATKIQREANQLKELAQVIAVGVNCANSQLLDTIASGPDDMFKASNYGELKRLEIQIKIRITEIAPEFQLMGDVLFIMDSSGSIGNSDYQKELKFVVDVTEYFNIGPKAVRFSAMIFSSTTKMIFDFDLTSHKHIKEEVMNAPYMKGGTDTAAALYEAETRVFRHARSMSKKIAIVITDGGSDDRNATEVAAKRLRDDGVLIIAVGVGSANKSELQSIASASDDVFYVDGYDVLINIRDNLARKMAGPGECSIL